MPCLFALVIVLFPRVALVLLFFFTNYLERAYHGLLLPVLGFFFVPLTTIVYAWMVNNGYPAEGINLLFLVIAVLADLGMLGGAYRSRD